jgi:hypothetical protein
MDRDIVPHMVLGASAIRRPWYRPRHAMNVPMPNEVLWLSRAAIEIDCLGGYAYGEDGPCLPSLSHERLATHCE